MTRSNTGSVLASIDGVGPLLLTGAAIVTVDPAVPDLPAGDVFIEGGRIVAVGADLRSDPEHADRLRTATAVDLRGRILAPGFVDTHRHAWQSQFRRSMPDVGDLASYVGTTLGEIAPAYTPQDMLIGTRLAALAALDCGITTMLDFSHNSRSAAHTDAAIEALVASGIRGVHASMAPHFGSWDEQWPADLARIVADRNGMAGGRLTVRMGMLADGAIGGERIAYGVEPAALARDLGIGVSIDAVFGGSSSAVILDWERQGILGPSVELIHATGLTGDAWRAIGDTGASVSLAPTSDSQIGLETAVPAIDEALAVGVRPGLSIDVEVALAGDMITQMRVLLAIQRMRAVEDGARTGRPAGPRITTHDVLEFATHAGARTVGLGDETGSITPGKRADLIIVDAESIATMPRNDAIGTLVLGAGTREIEGVLVDGIARKWAGELVGVDVDRLREQVIASRAAIEGRLRG
ncbi:amidohydrolase family protein [Actinoalloteichus hymeniacidonis]|uniref:Cytosine deaminase-like metal-dependent hydrolase n=1 Tax=Actinoalloteichus hymeniacidonis TaxID=340345 RepID=A0AAC9HMR0_9PSEU|nr:amidohydrolase family protein [Actinoalloteichus hymeniacidonis]AOS62202.1 cytosine deaminase-like metal-dependent hydrolase [Actinoalloteichus hymeniacidonis]MBB5909773.1 cytosine/adenosine deaminase-related metal-dependent hydrolase [Actinoalloteichus hymeniacidonis]